MKQKNQFAYPAIVKQGKVARVVQFVDVPEAITQVDEGEDLEVEAREILILAISERMRDGREIPEASASRRGKVVVSLPLWFAAKVALHKTMTARRYKNADLARLLGVPSAEVARMLNPERRIKIDTIAEAIESMGGEMTVSFSAEPC